MDVGEGEAAGAAVEQAHAQVAFYEQLGFTEVRRFEQFEANEMETPAGVRINLIFNGTCLPHGRNVLLDEPVKLPGVTHPAFVVGDLYALPAPGCRKRWSGPCR
mgnify:CR=1 FL=1